MGKNTHNPSRRGLFGLGAAALAAPVLPALALPQIPRANGYRPYRGAVVDPYTWAGAPLLPGDFLTIEGDDRVYVIKTRTTSGKMGDL
jgi:hypothetical protein